MADERTSRRWLVAAWPGMANVGVIAAGYLAQKLGLEPAAEVVARNNFDVTAVTVRAGLIGTPHLPRSLFLRQPGRDADAPAQPGEVIVFLGEAQPATGAFSFAQALLDRAAGFGIDRIVTFASMASQLHPSEQPRVFGAATQGDLLDELRAAEIKALEEGQIGGMNGVLLGAAAERGLAGMCVMGEIPFFAAGVPNPKAAKAVLEAFSLMSGRPIDLKELSEDAEKIDQALIQMLERMQDQQEGEPPEPWSGGGEAISEGAADEPEPAAEKPEPTLPPQVRQRIERLFKEAQEDRSKAMALKRELDRHGVFAQYENRFLDLFRRAE